MVCILVDSSIVGGQLSLPKVEPCTVSKAG